MRIESSVMSVSWIPSEAVTGMTKLPFEVGVTHYDNPPPDVIDDLEGLGAADRFRFANRLRAWIEVEGGAIVDHGYAGGANLLHHQRLGAHGGRRHAVRWANYHQPHHRAAGRRV